MSAITIPPGTAVAPPMPDILPDVKPRRGLLGFIRRNPTMAFGAVLLHALLRRRA